MHFQGNSHTSILGEKIFKHKKCNEDARRKGHFLLTQMGVCILGPLLSSLKTKEEIGGETASTKGDVFIPSLPSECNLNKLDLPLSQVCNNFVSMFELEQIIDEFLE